MSSPSSSGDDRACAVLASKRAARCIAAARAGRLVQVLSRPKLSARDDPRQDALDAMGEAHGPGSTLSDVRSSVCFSVLRHEASSVPGRRIGSDGFLDLSGSGDIHYDTMLGALSPPGGAAASQVSVQRGGWWEGAVDE